MQATGTLQGPRFSTALILVAIAMLSALVLGAAAGYLVRGAGPAATSPVHAQQKVDTIQTYPNADLTRVLPTSAPADPAAGYDISQWTGSSAAQPDHGFLP